MLYDPLIAPERRVNVEQYPYHIKNMINIPSRGYPDNYQLMGLLSRQTDEKILKLFGRQTFLGSSQYEYYALNEHTNIKIPIEIKGNKEIYDNQHIHIPMLNNSKGEFKVKLYNYNTPRYNPHI